MKLPLTSLLFCLLIVLGMTTAGLSQTRRVKPPPAEQLNLKRINPDGWFSLLFPLLTEKVGRHADVDGGFIGAATFRIDWTYWTYENTPNYLRNSAGRDSGRPLPACPRNPVTKIKIDGKNALVQQCFHKNAVDGFRYEYYLTFPKANIDNGQSSADGVFSLSVYYKSPSRLRIAEQIVRSLKFRQINNKVSAVLKLQ